jgi:hypothetical protein
MLGVALAVVAAADAGCAGAPARDAHARHADILRSEATLERALAREARAARSPGSPSLACEERAASAAEALAAAERVCEVARELDDEGAAVRCERASRRADDAAAGLTGSGCARAPR